MASVEHQQVAWKLKLGLLAVSCSHSTSGASGQLIGKCRKPFFMLLGFMFEQKLSLIQIMVDDSLKVLCSLGGLVYTMSIASLDCVVMIIVSI